MIHWVGAGASAAEHRIAKTRAQEDAAQVSVDRCKTHGHKIEDVTLFFESVRRMVCTRCDAKGYEAL